MRLRAGRTTRASAPSQGQALGRTTFPANRVLGGLLVHRARAVRGAFIDGAYEPGSPPVRRAATAPGRQ